MHYRLAGKFVTFLNKKGTRGFPFFRFEVHAVKREQAI